MTGSQQLILGEGAGGSGVANYIEDVFSTWLYTGNGSTQTITNGIDVTGKGGLIWFKERASQGFDHALVDTARGNLSSTEGYSLASNQTAAQSSVRAVPTSSGFSLSSGSGAGPVNFNGSTYASWTFRKQAKFFDVVTYTGNGSDQNIAHNLGSVPGFVVIKRTNTTGNWSVWHRSIGNTYLILNTTAKAEATGNPARTVTSTTFQIYGNFPDEGANGSSYVMYLFAHDAGGFGAAGTDNVISCGSFTYPGSYNEVTVNLGWEPQWVLIKNTTNNSDGIGWVLVDNMRGIPVSGSNATLFPNSSAAENFGYEFVKPTATGFTTVAPGAFYWSNTYIYIAIRRGPMKTPTTGTSVYGAAYNYINDYVNISTGIVADAAFEAFAGVSDPGSNNLLSRLTGGSILRTASTNAQSGPSTDTRWDSMNGMTPGIANNTAGLNALLYTFRRAPGFFDVVCYTGTGSNLTLNHNLGVAPELMIIKARSASSPWAVYAASEGINKTADLNRGDLGFYTETGRWLATPTATQFSVKPGATLNSAGQTQVAYLFASAAGVSKVGSYTGTGALQTINCGFTSGARWVMIKRADSAGDWFVYDSTRGITSGNDPYLLFNSTAAQVTNTNYVDTTSVGFQVTAAAPAGLNANGGTYIFLAVS